MSFFPTFALLILSWERHGMKHTKLIPCSISFPHITTYIPLLYIVWVVRVFFLSLSAVVPPWYLLYCHGVYETPHMTQISRAITPHLRTLSCRKRKLGEDLCITNGCQEFKLIGLAGVWIISLTLTNRIFFSSIFAPWLQASRAPSSWQILKQPGSPSTNRTAHKRNPKATASSSFL